MTAPPVDLRSDTVTRPGAGMREAMAAAVVGDDVYGDDPTVLELERRVAAFAGTEAALFTVSGTMANQLAIRVHAGQGDELYAHRDSHIVSQEAGAASALFEDPKSAWNAAIPRGMPSRATTVNGPPCMCIGWMKLLFVPMMRNLIRCPTRT